MSRGLIFFLYNSITAIPACLASFNLSEYTAGIVPLPLSPMPNASVRQFIELAVYIPEHEPHVGQALHSYSFNSSRDILPAALAPTASNIDERLVLCPPTCPASIGPPETNTVGTFTLAAAINNPGTFLSQLGIITKASNW